MNRSAPAKITLQPKKIYARVIKVVGIGAVGATAVALLSQKSKSELYCVTVSHVGEGSATHTDKAFQLLVHDTDMLFIVAQADDVAALKLAAFARTLGILTVAVLAEDVAAVQSSVDADSVVTAEAKHLPAALQQVVHGLVDSERQAGLLNLDSDEIHRFLKNQGAIQIGTGISVWETRAQQATEQALRREMSDASTVLITVTSTSALKLSELDSVVNTVTQKLPHALLLVSSVFDEGMGGALRVTLISGTR